MRGFRGSSASSWLTQGLLSSVAQVRVEERGLALGAFLTLFGFMAGHALLETARDALFLASLPAVHLPWVYLGIAAFALSLAHRQPAFLQRLPATNELSGWLIVSSVVTAAFWIVIPFAGSWIFYGLYMWSGILATIVVVRFWTAVGNLFTVTQAKRIFPIVGAGSVGGAIVGSAVARTLTVAFAAQHIVIAAAVAFLLASVAPRLLGTDAGRRPSTTRPWDLARIGRDVWHRPYLRRVVLLILLATVTFTLVDFIFKLTVSRLVPDEELGSYFAGVYLTFNVMALAVQLLAVAWVVRRFGVHIALALVPLLVVLGSVGMVLTASLLAGLLLKSVDGSTRHTLYRTSTELLFVPLAVEVRGRAKAFIDVVGQRGGQALGSVLILVVLTATTSERAIALLLAVVAMGWLTVAWGLRRHYLDVFRETLSAEITDVRLHFPALDVTSLETLLAALNSPDDRRVIAALDLLQSQNKIPVVPALILYHPSSAVVIRALELFASAQRRDCEPLLSRLRGHPDPDVRAAALRFEAAVAADRAAIERALTDAAPQVRATAATALAAGGWASLEETVTNIRSQIVEGGRDAKIAVARALTAQPVSGLEPLLRELMVDGDAAVVREAVVAARGMRGSTLLPHLIELLAVRSARAEVRITLLAFGPGTIPRLASALADPTVSHAVRRHLPHAIGTFGTPAAADALLGHLQRETDGMVRFKILRALGRLRRDHPDIVLDGTLLQRAFTQTLATARSFMTSRRTLEASSDLRVTSTEAHSAIIALLRDKQQHAVERLMRLLNLQTSNDDYLHIYHGLHSRKREAQAGSRELLEHLLGPDRRQAMLELVDDLLDAGVGRTPEATSMDDYERVLVELLNGGIESLSSLAAQLIGDLRLTDLERPLAKRVPLSPEHRDVLVVAREAFDLGPLAEGTP